MAVCCWCQSPLVSAEGAFWCALPACQTRQAEWAVAVTERKTGARQWLFVPTPKQVTFYEQTRRTRRTLFGGQAAGAKSHAIRWGLYRDCMTIPNLNCLLLRRTFKQLEQTHLLAMERDARLIGAEYLSGTKTMKFPNGSIIQAGHCESSADAMNYLSTEYDRIAFDELVTFDRDPSLEIMSRARTSKPHVVAAGDSQVWAGTNPGGRGARWVKDFFIDRTVDLGEFPSYTPARYGFVPANVDDNPYISPEYVRDLQDLPEMRKRQLLYGDWDVFEGQFFEELRAQREGQPYHATTMSIPPNVEWSCGMDWGFNAVGVIGWYAHLSDGHYHRKREYKFKGQTADQVATAFWRVTKDLGVRRVRYVSGDPAMWSKTGAGGGESIAETLIRRRIPMRRGDNDRFNGALRVHEMLRPDEAGMPYLTVDPACTYWWRTLPGLTQDPHDPDDVDTTQEDHAYDETRYWAMSRPSPTRVRVETAPPVGSWGHATAWHEQQERNNRGVLA